MPVKHFAAVARLFPPPRHGGVISASARDRGSGLRMTHAAAGAMVAAALTLGLVAVRVRGQEQLIIYGIGAQRCSSWTQSRGVPAERRANLTWMQGYMTAAAIHGPDETRIARATDKEILATVDAYCRENPKDSVLSAASSLVRHFLLWKDGTPVVPPPPIRKDPSSQGVRPGPFSE